MRPKGMNAGFRQFLPLLAAVSIVSGSATRGQESFPNELNSPIDEPLVVLHESLQKVPVRSVAREIEESKDPLVKLVYETHH